MAWTKYKDHLKNKTLELKLSSFFVPVIISVLYWFIFVYLYNVWYFYNPAIKIWDTYV